MDPAYGDDLWAGGFSSDEEGEQQSQELDLLASLVEKTGGGERSSVAEEKGEKSDEKKETFEEALTKADDVSIMKAKMEAMEKELQTLRQQVATTSSTSHTHQARPHPQSQTAPKKSPPTLTTLTVTTATNKPGRKRKMAAEEPSDGAVARDRSVAEKIVSGRKSDREQNIVTDVFSGLRIKNPVVSSELMRKRMEGRKMVKIPSIASRVRGTDIAGDWVTAGVVVDKLPPKESAKGNKYAVWKLSDLSSQSAVVSLFLFGKAYQEHWKMVQGSVVALLNPTIMPNRETGAVDTSSKQLALSLDLPQKLMRLGVSQDFTVCRATTRAGCKCSNFANASDGGFCDYHIQGAYKKIRTGRMDCQGGYGPSTANIRGKLFKDSKTDVFYYGGRSYTAGGSSGKGGGGGGGGEGEGRQDKRLFARGARESLAEVSQEVASRKVERERVAGSTRTGRSVTTSEGGNIFQQMLQTQRPGAVLMNRHLQKEEEKKKQAVRPAEKSASELLREERTREDKTVAGSHSTLSPFQPRLGRGLTPGSVVDFSNASSPAHTKTRLAAVKKLKAAAILREKEKVEREENDILRRVEENRTTIQQSTPAGEEGEEGEGEEEGPLKKKRRKMNSAEIEKIMNAKSSHDWEAREAEWEREEQYFTLREKKENMEERLGSIRELHVHVSQCRQCDYVAESAGELCQKEGHALSRYKAVKRWFECKECRERACTYNARYPPFPCRKCGSKSFKQTSFFRERKGPKIGSENLLLRGREEKFLN